MKMMETALYLLGKGPRKHTIILILILTISLCLIINGCAFSGPVVGDSSRNIPNIDIEKKLGDDRNEFLDIPWFSPVSKAFETLKITREDIIIIELDDQIFEFALPVSIDPFNRKAKMIMRYSLDEELNEGEGALTEIYFDMFADDEADYEKLIKEFSQIADRPDLPYLVEDSDIEYAVENRQSLGTISSNDCFDETTGRDCSQNLQITAGDFAPSGDIAQTFDNPIAVRVAMWISLYDSKR